MTDERKVRVGLGYEILGGAKDGEQSKYAMKDLVIRYSEEDLACPKIKVKRKPVEEPAQ